MKFYIHQLKDGKMLTFEDGFVFVEDTGYPLPNCEVALKGNILKNGDEILQMLLGYPIDNAIAFINTVKDMEKMSLTDFKYWVQGNNIGGGCPRYISDIVLDIKNEGLTFNQAVFKHVLPYKFLSEEYNIPSDEDLKNEYCDLLRLSWKYIVNNPNANFRDTMVLYKGLSNVDEKYVEFFKDVVTFLCSTYWQEYFKYLSVITSENGRSAIILCNTYEDNIDIEYFYSVITGASAQDGIIHKSVVDNKITVSFESFNDFEAKQFTGVVKRYEL